MNRWHSRLAQLRRGIGEGLTTVQNVQNVQNPSPEPVFERIERFERRASLVPAFAKAPSHSDKEDEGHAENKGEDARDWAKALARLDPAKPPGDVPAHRWSQFIENCRVFLEEGWAER